MEKEAVDKGSQTVRPSAAATRATELLGTSAETSGAFRAWEEAWSRLLLAEVLADGDAASAQHGVAGASRLRVAAHVRELERARSLIARLAA